MVSLEGIYTAITSNWVSMVVTIGATVVTLFFSRRYQTNAREERLNQAKQDVLSVIEEHIIDNKDLTTPKYDYILRAAEREHSVPLRRNTSKVSILEDLVLKIEKSPHLNTDQKQEYSTQIRQHIESIRENDNTPEITKSREEILESLETNIEEGNEEEAEAELEALRSEISSLEKYVNKNSHGSGPVFSSFTIFEMAATIMITFIVYFFIFSQLVDIIPLFGESLLPILTLMTMIVFFVIITGNTAKVLQ